MLDLRFEGVAFGAVDFVVKFESLLHFGRRVGKLRIINLKQTFLQLFQNEFLLNNALLREFGNQFFEEVLHLFKCLLCLFKQYWRNEFGLPQTKFSDLFNRSGVVDAELCAQEVVDEFGEWGELRNHDIDEHLDLPIIKEIIFILRPILVHVLDQVPDEVSPETLRKQQLHLLFNWKRGVLHLFLLLSHFRLDERSHWWREMARHSCSLCRSPLVSQQKNWFLVRRLILMDWVWSIARQVAWWSWTDVDRFLCLGTLKFYLFEFVLAD